MGSVKIEDKGGGTLLATLDNPPHGLMDAPMVDELDALVTRAESDPGVTAVVFTGAHPDRFLAHYDVGELLAGAKGSPSVGPGAAKASLSAVAAVRRVPGGAAAIERTPLAGLSAAERFGEVFLRMNRAGAVFVAAINGSAQGGGCELSLACDFRLMAEGDFAIGQPEVLFAFPPGGGGTQRLARLVGSAAALRLCLDGGPLTPAEAHELGVVDEVVEPGTLMDRALELAERLGRRHKAAIGAVKRSIYEGGSLPLVDGLRKERAEFMSTIATPESKRAMQAYVDRLEATGELPAYDPATMKRALDDGRFT